MQNNFFYQSALKQPKHSEASQIISFPLHKSLQGFYKIKQTVNM